MNKAVRNAAVAALTLTASNSYAADWYAGLDLTRLTYNKSGFDEAQMGGWRQRAGLRFWRFLSAEAQLGFGTSHAHIASTNAGPGEDVEINYFAGALVRAELPILPTVRFFANGGYTDLSVESTTGGVTTRDNYGDISYGAGIEYWLGRDFALSVDYTELTNSGKNFTSSAASFGVKASF